MLHRRELKIPFTNLSSGWRRWLIFPWSERSNVHNAVQHIVQAAVKQTVTVSLRYLLGIHWLFVFHFIHSRKLSVFAFPVCCEHCVVCVHRRGARSSSWCAFIVVVSVHRGGALKARLMSIPKPKYVCTEPSGDVGSPHPEQLAWGECRQSRLQLGVHWLLAVHG